MSTGASTGMTTGASTGRGAAGATDQLSPNESRPAGPAPQVAPVAVVTGAAGHIGGILLELLTARGFRVAGLDLPAACPPGDDRYVPCNVRSDESVHEAMDVVLARLERIDLLVIAAGLSATGSLTEHPLTSHRAVMEVTHFGAVSSLFAALSALRASSGRVVLIGSVAGFAPVLGRPAYVAAKHAVTGLFEAARPELAEMGVGVTVVHPTFVAGGMGDLGSQRLTTGTELTGQEVAEAIVEGALTGKERVLVGRTAQWAWLLSRHTPRLYQTLMIRRLRAERRGP